MAPEAVARLQIEDVMHRASVSQIEVPAAACSLELEGFWDAFR